MVRCLTSVGGKIELQGEVVWNERKHNHPQSVSQELKHQTRKEKRTEAWEKLGKELDKGMKSLPEENDEGKGAQKTTVNTEALNEKEEAGCSQSMYTFLILPTQTCEDSFSFLRCFS